MTTPVADFLRNYADGNTLRMHMPGHKGEGDPLCRLDLTEVEGADVLYREEGILRESQENAASCFDTAATLYSTEGSSLAIRAMLLLTAQYARARGRKPRILAARNAHKVFYTATALLNIPVDLLSGEGSLMSCPVTAEQIRLALSSGTRPTAVYLTSPDYLGNRQDLREIAALCHHADVLLLVDNAHGAYLKFLPEDLHPMTLGADLCCDSAHKTLPALTGAAYLHVSKSAPSFFVREAKRAMATFASTSPSYLILRSLDLLNKTLCEGYRETLAEFCRRTDGLKSYLTSHGYRLVGDEPLKLTILAKPYGYRGEEIAEHLRSYRIECELADPDYTVLMLTPSLEEDALRRLAQALVALPKRAPILDAAPRLPAYQRKMSPSETLLCPAERLPVELCVDRILADPTVACPPAVPIVLCGEVITSAAVTAFRYYGITECLVVKEYSPAPELPSEKVSTSTVAPQPTVAPQATVAPQPTVAPQATVAPQPTVAPQATVAPKATATPTKKKSPLLSYGTTHGGNALEIYDRGVIDFGWKKFKRISFFPKTRLFELDVTPEGYSVWMIPHNSLREMFSESHSWFSIFKGDTIEEVWFLESWKHLPERSLRVTFAKTSDGYVFQGLFCLVDAKIKSFGGKPRLVKYYKRVSDEYPPSYLSEHEPPRIQIPKVSEYSIKNDPVSSSDSDNSRAPWEEPLLLLEAVEDGCKICALILEQKKETTVQVDLSARPFQRDLLDKRVGDTFTLPGVPFTYRIEKILPKH